jgi:protocatechuate 3,4-dioxygenase beta subunit
MNFSSEHPILLADDDDDDPSDLALVDRGLAFDLTTLTRRDLLRALGFGGVSAGLFTLAGCSPAASGTTTPGGAANASTGGSASSAAGASCALIPEETAGPFPGDGSNGPDVLNQSGVVRTDIRSSFGSSSNVAQGVPLTIKLTIEDATDCVPISKAAVYLWHCDRDGNYSMYSQPAVNENYLRGVQEADGSGVVTFTSIFPACYPGRWPHIHFEVYPTLGQATDQGNKIATSQVALPKDICDQVYATDGYAQSIQALSQLSLDSDMVFRDDGAAHQLGTISGSVANGLTVELTVPVAA